MIQSCYDFRITVIYFEKIAGKRNMCADVVGEIKTNEGSVEIVASEVKLFICVLNVGVGVVKKI